MKLNLMSCTAQRPDKRAIAKCIANISYNGDETLSSELTNILLEGDLIEIQIPNKNSSSAFRLLRKLGIDYQIVG